MWYSCKNVQFLVCLFTRRGDMILKRKIIIKFYPYQFFFGAVFNAKIFNLSCTGFIRTYTNRWYLPALPFIWFFLNQFNRELVDFSKLLITLSRLKSKLFGAWSSAELVISQNEPLWNCIYNFRVTTKGIITFCSLLSIGKKNLNYSERLVVKTIGSKFNY